MTARRDLDIGAGDLVCFIIRDPYSGKSESHVGTVISYKFANQDACLNNPHWNALSRLREKYYTVFVDSLGLVGPALFEFEHKLN